MHQISKKIALGAVLAISAYSSFAAETSAPTHGTISGSATVLNKYIYRGGEENDDVTLQAGLEYAHNSGFFAGYWGSTLMYDPTDETEEHGFEHDFYVGFANDINEDWSYKTQIVSYVYQGGGSIYNEDRSDKRRTTAVELINDINYKDFTFSTGVLLNDVNYGNAGDLYLSAAYSYALPQDFSLNTSVGAFVYNDAQDDDFVTTNKHLTFSEARLGLSKPLANTGAELSLDYIWTGKDREGSSLDDHFVIGLNYSF